jgi:LysR family hydrogen peroxide-inducible transcriptional activator
MTIMLTTALPFTLRQLQYVVAVAETRHFRRAAERCAVVQPSLSAQVAALETALGVRIFERGRGGVLVTPAGEALVEKARQILRDAEDLAREACRFQDPLNGPLRLGVIPTVGPYLLPRLVPALREAYPSLVPLWTEERTQVLVKAVGEGRLDGAILAKEADLENLDMAPLGTDPFLVALPREHPLAGSRGPLALEALAGEPMLLLDDGHCLRTQVIQACADARVEERGYRATSLATLVQMVASGAGITLLPQVALETETHRAPVVVRPFRRPAPYRTLVLAWRRNGRLAPVFREMAEKLGWRKPPPAEAGLC